MIRPQRVAGQFYPAEEDVLRSQIRSFLDADPGDAPAEDEGVRALIVPHAGYIFSGAQAGRAYRCLEGRSFDVICVISPSHYDYFQGLSIYPGSGYQTPLGVMKIDDSLRKIICEKTWVEATDAGHGREHALEVQLPFLQYVLGADTRLLPLVMGSQDEQTIETLISCLQYLIEELGEKLLVVASSDLSHFHPADQARRMDERCIEAIGNFDGRSFWSSVRNGDVEACGAGPIAAVLRTFEALPGSAVHTLGYSHSGQVIPDRSSVVGYSSAIITMKRGGHEHQ